MFPERVLITGAAGFMGSRLCEVLSLTAACKFRAFIHSTGAAARIARFPLDFAVGDLCDSRAVENALEGCDAVVHLARGSARVMEAGLENVLRAAARRQVMRFVHMSSVAVYGNCPPPESVTEDVPARRSDLAYGNAKLAEEVRVRRYGKRGLPIVILRPPNVYGPFSAFTLGALQKIRAGRLPIVDGGTNPCNLVYIDNLIQATLLSLWKPEAVGQTFFVTNREPVTWERCLEDYARPLGASLPRVDASKLSVPRPQRFFRDSIRALPRAAFSPEFRSSLRRVPVFGAAEQWLYRRFESLSPEKQQSVRLRLHGPEQIAVNGLQRQFDSTDNLIAAQARTVAHSSKKAEALLGYTAPISYEEGMALTRDWLRFARVLA